MRFYNKYWSSNYDELITYYPRYYRDVLEMRAILESHGMIADELEENIEQSYYNTFVDLMDDEALADFESFLHIPPDSTKTLEERRYYVKGLLAGRGKLNETMIKSVVKSFTGGECLVTFAGSVVTVRIFPPDGGEGFRFEDVEAVLKPLMPAHLGLEIVRFYSTWGNIKNNYTDWAEVKAEDNWTDIKNWIGGE